MTLNCLQSHHHLSQQPMLPNPSLLPPCYHPHCLHPASFFLSLVPPLHPLVPPLQSALDDIAASYNSQAQGVYYHNLSHGYDVALTMDRLMSDVGYRSRYKIDEEEYVMYLVAAYGHDGGHMGLSNQYYNETEHELALLYLYQAPLQHMHASKLLKILKRNNVAVKAETRKRMVAMILATDTQQHSAKLDKLAAMDEGQLGHQDTFVLGVLLHAADISNPTKDYGLFLEWGTRIQAEFAREKDLRAGREPQLEYQISRGDNVRQLRAFAGKLVLPLYRAMDQKLGGLGEWVRRIEGNLDRLREEEGQMKEAEQGEQGRQTEEGKRQEANEDEVKQKEEGKASQ